MGAKTDPAPTPALRGWLEGERAWGRHALHAAGAQRERLIGETHGLERFARRMALVSLTGSVAKWANGLHEGLTRNGQLAAAAAFQAPPPFPDTDAGPADCDRLSDYLHAHIDAIGEVLAADEQEA